MFYRAHLHHNKEESLINHVGFEISMFHGQQRFSR